MKHKELCQNEEWWELRTSWRISLRWVRGSFKHLFKMQRILKSHILAKKPKLTHLKIFKMWSRMKSRSWPTLITDGWSLVCYSRNGTSLEELNCSCCTVASCDWRYPVSKLVVEWAETINNRGYISVLQLYEGEQVVVSLRCFLVDDYLLPEDGECEVFPSWRQPPPRWIMESMKQEWITLTWMRWSHMFRPPSKMKWSPAVSALISDEEIMLCCCKGS